jgi:hypothetical protein
MSTETIFPSLSRTKRFTINWSKTVTPVKNFQYFFGFDQEVKDGLLTGLQPEVATVQPIDINFANFNGLDTNDNDFLKFAYITLLNDKGEMVVDSIPVLSLFNANVGVTNLPGLVIRKFNVNVDPSKSYITFNYNAGDLPASVPTGINFTWYYKKRII